MKILHCCLSNYYVDHFAYQENELAAAHVGSGHEVLILASTETFGADKSIVYVDPGEYLGSDGARVIRLPYRRWLPHLIARKLRAHPGVLHVVESFQPDVIVFHGTCGWELRTICKYVKTRSNVLLYVDSHEDFNNSARTFLSKWLLHYLFYRPILLSSLQHIKKILCVNIDSMHFLRDLYGVPVERLEFFPLGGRILSNEEYHDRRTLARSNLMFGSEEIIFIQTGKMDRSKKLIETLQAFKRSSNPNFRFLVAGSLQDDIQSLAKDLISSDNRIRYLGWLDTDALQSALCSADVYIQPGTQSATMQMSLCCRCAVAIADIESHEPYVKFNGWLLSPSQPISKVFEDVEKSPTLTKEMGENSGVLAKKMLDYAQLSKRVLQ